MKPRSESFDALGLGRVLTLYQPVRPLLVALSRVALIPPALRTAVRMFVTALDALLDANPTFKMGKDL